MKKISILLPYKENFSPSYPGAVSLFVKDTTNISKYKKNISVFGSTTSKSNLNNYINITLKKNFLTSTSNQYLKNFSNYISKENIEILISNNIPHISAYALTVEPKTALKKYIGSCFSTTKLFFFIIF